jgi:phosphoserine phosphatase
VIGSDLLKAELKRHELESMEGLDDVTKDVIRQFASEEMVRQASAGCDIFICEGHAALLPARSLSRLEKAWRQVQVWLGKRDSVFDVSVGFTELDKAFFNEVILVEADDEVIQERRVADQDKRRPTDLDSIRADIEAERSKAAEICRESGAALRVVDANISSLAETTLRGLLTASASTIETVPMYHQRKIIERAGGLPAPGNNQPIFLFDADNTLGPYDASQIILKFLGNGTYERMKKNFKRGYSHYSFLMHHHIHLKAGDRFDECVEALGSVIKLSDEVLGCLRECMSKGPVVILTAGIPEVWRIALRSHGLPVGSDYAKEIVVHGLVDGADGLVMDEQGKETFARAAKEMGYYVVAAGDSQIDTGMLRVADAAFVVARDFGEYEVEISKRHEKKKLSKSERSKKIKNERLFMLTAGHPRVFQIPAFGASMAIGGPQLSSFRDLVHDALRADYVKQPPADIFRDYLPRFLAWLETLPEHPKNKKSKDGK